MANDADSRAAQRRHALYQDVVDKVCALLTSYELGEGVSGPVAEAVADMLADSWGGQVLSFPKDVMRRLTAKELEIYDQFNGRNLPELARQYGYTQRGMEKLIARIRGKLATQARELQRDLLHDLFSGSDATSD
jgi:Mor family transcriptional regulator